MSKLSLLLLIAGYACRQRSPEQYGQSTNPMTLCSGCMEVPKFSIPPPCKTIDCEVANITNPLFREALARECKETRGDARITFVPLEIDGYTEGGWVVKVYSSGKVTTTGISKEKADQLLVAYLLHLLVRGPK